jgi:tetratricopeptide (TPR) repeat protein
MYRMLQREVGLTDPRLADILSGQADVAYASGKYSDALQLLRAAAYIPGQDLVLQARIATLNARIQSRIDITLALRMFQKTHERFPGIDGSVGANLMFWYGDALLAAGDYEQAMDKFIRAYDLAYESEASVTLADSMRRLPLVRALLGHADHSIKAIHDLQSARDLYQASGDRGEMYLHTEAGEVFRSLGKWRESEEAFQRGVWASRDISDRNRQAHNLLGLFQVCRQTGRMKTDLLDQAEEIYQYLMSDWGMVHVQIGRALAEPENKGEYLTQASQIIQSSKFSSFPREREIIGWIAGASDEEIRNYPHLMNYP